MSTESGASRSRRNGRRSDPRTLRRFVEEFSWLLTSYRDLDFDALGQLAAEGNIREQHSPEDSKAEENFHLLGMLPSLFLDQDLFESNEDIAEFSTLALGVNIPRWKKKSKYEIIGHVVCNANMLDNTRLRQLVRAVRELRDGESSSRDFVRSQRKSGQSWNEVIQIMLRDY